MSFDRFQPHVSQSTRALTALAPFSSKSLSIGSNKPKPNSIQHRRRRPRKQSAKRNSSIKNNRLALLGGSRTVKLKTWVERLETLYRFRNRDEVISFIQEHPSLIQLLSDAHQKIQHYFGTGVEVVLEIFTDYEVPTYHELMVVVQTTLPIKEALDHLDRLYQEWWADASVVAPLKMSIDVETI